MGLGKREMPEREPDTADEFCFDAFDFPVSLPRVGALVVAVLDNDRARGWPADVVDHVVHWLQGRLVLPRWRAACHGSPPGPVMGCDAAGFQKPTACRIRTIGMRPGSFLADLQDLLTWLCCP